MSPRPDLSLMTEQESTTQSRFHRFFFLTHVICQPGGGFWAFVPPRHHQHHHRRPSVLTPHTSPSAPSAVCVGWRRGRKGVSRDNAAQPPVLFALDSPLRVSMATHSLGNPPSSSRWGDDAAVCLHQSCGSPPCEPACVVYGVVPRDGVRQINGSVMHTFK